MNLGQKSIQDALEVDKNENEAKNSIIYVGDGMGMSTITAGRIFKGQLEGQPGEEGYLTFEKFVNVGLLKVHCASKYIKCVCVSVTLCRTVNCRDREYIYNYGSHLSGSITHLIFLL